MTTSIKAKLLKLDSITNGRKLPVYLKAGNWFLGPNKFIYKFDEKVLTYRILIKGILTFLRLNYKDASLEILYLVVLGINFPKIR